MNLGVFDNVAACEEVGRHDGSMVVQPMLTEFGTRD